MGVVVHRSHERWQSSAPTGQYISFIRTDGELNDGPHELSSDDHLAISAKK